MKYLDIQQLNGFKDTNKHPLPKASICCSFDNIIYFRLLWIIINKHAYKYSITKYNVVNINLNPTRSHLQYEGKSQGSLRKGIMQFLRECGYYYSCA